MLEIAEFRDEKIELQAILDSGIFSRAPHLLSFLTYVCERYFRGEADQIKEYTIGVEALRRPAEFDPKRDSIVRVEAHRLRRRLDEYYNNQGASHRVRILIPNGQYVPRFVLQENHSEADPQIAATTEPRSVDNLIPNVIVNAFTTAPATSLPHVAPSPRGWKWAVPLLGLGLAIALILTLSHHRPAAAFHEEVFGGSSTQPVPAEYRMMAGYHGPQFTDRQGHVWNPDAYFSGGASEPIAPDHRIDGQPDEQLLKSQRTGKFRYDIPVAQGNYELHLYFAETDYGPGNPLGGGETSRLFQVSINGQPVMERFDPLAESGGPNRLLVRVFKDIVPASDGKLHLAFTPFSTPGRANTSDAFLNGLEILQSSPGRVHCVRIVTQDHPITDLEGHVWSSDEYFFGGMLATRDIPVVSARDKSLYRGERYGNFAYRIPLAPGKYRVTLYFAETWFGTPEARQSGSESRRFNVFANGAPLLQNFEIAQEVGPGRELAKVFENLQPNSRGALWLEFVPLENYAEVNAIEVEQMD